MVCDQGGQCQANARWLVNSLDPEWNEWPVMELVGWLGEQITAGYLWNSLNLLGSMGHKSMQVQVSFPTDDFHKSLIKIGTCGQPWVFDYSSDLGIRSCIGSMESSFLQIGEPIPVYRATYYCGQKCTWPPENWDVNSACNIQYFDYTYANFVPIQLLIT